MISNDKLKNVADITITGEDENLMVRALFLKEMAKELLTARQLAQDMKCLRKLMGYVENGSEQTVALYQDDATMSFIIKTKTYTKENRYWGHSLREAIQKAFEAEGDGT